MGEVKNRSLRLDDDNYGWLSGLPGRTLNDALTDYRASLDGPDVPGPLAELRERIDRVGGQLSAQIEDLPDDDRIADVMRTVIAEVKAQRAGAAQVPSGSVSGDPGSIPGVVRGVQNLPARPVRESGNQRAERERGERQQRARDLDSVDDISIDRGDDFVSG